MKKSAQDLTPLELELMQILWRSGPSTVQAVHRQMQEKRALAYNTVQTMLTILHRKGRVHRVTEKRAYLYSAAVTEERAATSAVRNLVDRLFGGDPGSLVLNMVRSKQLTAEQLAKLRALIEKEEAADAGD